MNSDNALQMDVENFYIDQQGNYQGNWVDSDPGRSDWIRVSVGPDYADQPWLFSETEPFWGPSPAQRAQAENEWRNTEMPIARENVIAIEFGDESIPGTAADWKAYWLALRAWVDGAEGYPDAARRPTSPQGETDGSERIEDGGTPRVPG